MSQTVEYGVRIPFDTRDVSRGRSAVTSDFREMSEAGVTMARRIVDATGKVVENTVQRARPQNVSVSLPSLRLDSFSVELADMVAETRRTGLTVAPEAASPRLRSVINKWIPDEDLLQMSEGAFKLG